jgi:hypothetical protein
MGFLIISLSCAEAEVKELYFGEFDVSADGIIESWNAERLEYRNDQRTIPLLQHSTAVFHSSAALITFCRASGNHAALEHFIGDRTCHAVEELRAHLRILAQHVDGFLF